MSSATTHVPPFSQLFYELGEVMDTKFWKNEICAIALIAAMIYIQVKWILLDHIEKLKTKSKREVELHVKSQEVRFADFKDEIVRIQEIHEQDMMNIHNHTIATQRLPERLFNDLATTEHKLNAATAARLRHQLETGGLWGKQLKDLQELSKAADEREKVWLKLVAYSPV